MICSKIWTFVSLDSVIWHMRGSVGLQRSYRGGYWDLVHKRFVQGVKAMTSISWGMSLYAYRVPGTESLLGWTVP